MKNTYQIKGIREICSASKLLSTSHQRFTSDPFRYYIYYDSRTHRVWKKFDSIGKPHEYNDPNIIRCGYICGRSTQKEILEMVLEAIKENS